MISVIRETEQIAEMKSSGIRSHEVITYIIEFNGNKFRLPMAEAHTAMAVMAHLMGYAVAPKEPNRGSTVLDEGSRM